MRTRLSVAPARNLVGAWISALLAGLCLALAVASPANALPSFAQQTGQACSQCHVGAYGPQLKQYGRDFKLYGYVNGDGKNTLPPISAILAEGFTDTKADRTPLPNHDANDNLAFSSGLVAYAGSLAYGAGAFAEASFDPLHRKWAWARVDVRRAWDNDVQGKDLLIGIEVNNRPGVGDLWNSTPVFEFSSATSAFAATPSASTYVDGKLAGRVAGPGVYAMWDNTFYAEFAPYLPIGNAAAKNLGMSMSATTDVNKNVTPYWRVAVQHTIKDEHYLEVGAYGLYAKRFPSGQRLFGQDNFTDTAFDASYQYVGSKEHFVSSHVTWIHEDENLDASQSLSHTNASDHLNTLRFDTLYSYQNTWTPAIELFRTTGSNDAKFFRTTNGSPNSEGYVVELAYTPWGKPNALINWGNARFAARYVAYGQFNGLRAGASNNNTIFLSASFAFAPFDAWVKR